MLHRNILPRSIIGNTRNFGSFILGSSPSGAIYLTGAGRPRVAISPYATMSYVNKNFFRIIKAHPLYLSIYGI